METLTTNDIGKILFPDSLYKRNMLNVIMDSIGEGAEVGIYNGYNVNLLHFGTFKRSFKKQVADQVHNETKDELASATTKAELDAIITKRKIRYLKEYKRIKSVHKILGIEARACMKQYYAKFAPILKNRGILRGDVVRGYFLIKTLFKLDIITEDDV